MDVRIQAIHFDVAEKLVDFINKKADRLARHHSALTTADVTLKVVKPETAMNKQAIVKLAVPQHEDLVADKTADTFEEAIDLALDALDRQLTRLKEKK
ncbi:MAG: ribosome hibernation-promoting factor, HPF/YfiA family [Muribaculaceae bacterium]